MPRPVTPRLFPLEDLARVVGYPRLMDTGGNPNGESFGIKELAGALGVTRRTIHRIKFEHGGMLTARQADEWAMTFGVHPACVWPDLWVMHQAEDIEPLEDVFDASDDYGDWWLRQQSA
jgi:hypothetical protein